MTVLYLVWELATGLNISDKFCSSILAFYRPGSLHRYTGLCTQEELDTVPLGVNFDLTTSPSISPKIVIISRSCLIVADCLAVGATWFALGLRFPTRRGDGFKGSITSVLLIDGTAFFLILAVLNSLHLTLTLISIAVEALQPISVVTIFTNPLSAILVSRFLLHLQSASLRAVGSLPPSQVSSLHLDHSLVFERVIGSLGASIAAEDYFMEDDLDNGDNGERADEPDLSQSSSE
ncbi:hypothetical protein BD310DRAFT_970857 [Dichomitus squalens]|uniref:Uncharacterized protein n=1 Tax=Dichomitus squalens TaxID=114155 RepID=A0A4Q9PC32_9APHY|nr:hypothetical protein BD310DRAFT_970857 [Dichomitus squalens]